MTDAELIKSLRKEIDKLRNCNAEMKREIIATNCTLKRIGEKLYFAGAPAGALEYKVDFMISLLDLD